MVARPIWAFLLDSQMVSNEMQDCDLDRLLKGTAP